MLCQTSLPNDIVKNHVMLKIENDLMSALIDTGATISCISENIVILLHKSKRIQRSTRNKLWAANNRPLSVKGEINLRLDFDGVVFHTNFQVVDSLSTGVLLGMDFLWDTKAKIDIENEKLIIGDAIEIQLMEKNEGLVRTATRVTIAGLSEAIIPVKIPWHFQKRTSLLRSAVPLGYNGVAGAKCIVKANTGPAPYRVLNLLTKSCTLKRGLVIAIITPFQTEAATELAAPAETVFSADRPNNQDLKFQRVALADIEIDLRQNKLSDAEFKTLTNLIYHNKDIFAVKTSDLTGALIIIIII